MADISAFMKYGSADSTSFFNSRLKGIARGFFESTGAPLEVVPGLLQVKVNPFRSVANDGMVVTLNTAENLPVFANETNHVVLRAARGASVGTDTLELVIQTAAQYAAEVTPTIRLRIGVIILGAVTEITTEIDLTVMDKVETLQRLSWKETVVNFAALPDPADPADVRLGDVRIVESPLTLYGFDGGGWISLATGEINTASNIGGAGVGLYDGKVGPDLQFKNIAAAASGAVSITDNPGNDTVEVDAVAATAGQRGTMNLANHLGGSAALPQVVGVTTTDGPTSLSIGSILDGETLVRVGGTLVGSIGIAASAASSTQFALPRYVDTGGQTLETTVSDISSGGWLTLGAITGATAKLELVEPAAINNGIKFTNTLSGNAANILQETAASDRLTISSDTAISLQVIGTGEVIRLDTEINIYNAIVHTDTLGIEWGTAGSGTGVFGDDSLGTLDINSSTGDINLRAGEDLILRAGEDGPTAQDIQFYSNNLQIARFIATSNDLQLIDSDLLLNTAGNAIRFVDSTHRIYRNLATDVLIVDGENGIWLDSEATVDIDATGDITIDTTSGDITLTANGALNDIILTADNRIDLTTTGTIGSADQIRLDTSASLADILLIPGGVVEIQQGDIFFTVNDQGIIFDSAVTGPVLRHDGVTDGLELAVAGETALNGVPLGLAVCSAVDGTSSTDFVATFENTGSATGTRNNVLRLILNTDIDTGGVVDYFVRAVAVEGGGSPVIQWSLDGEGNAVKAPFTGSHPVVYQSAAANTLLSDEVLPGMIVESTGIIWNSASSSTENAWTTIQGSNTNNSKTVYGVFSGISDSFKEHYYWKAFDQAFNQVSACPTIQIAADLTWDGTMTILTSDTSEVSVGVLLKFGEFVLESFLVSNVEEDVSITFVNRDSFTIPSGSGAGATYIHDSDVVEPVQLATTVDSVYFKSMTNSVGEGQIWVTDFGGDVANGDYISSSEVVDENDRFGYGQKQVDDILHSYTVAKCVENVNWGSVSDTFTYNAVSYKRALVACTYHCG